MRRGCRPRTPAIAQAPLGWKRNREGGCAARPSQARGRRTTPPPPFSSAPAVPHLLSPPPFFPSRAAGAEGNRVRAAPKRGRLRLRKKRLSPLAEGELGAGERREGEVGVGGELEFPKKRGRPLLLV